MDTNEQRQESQQNRREERHKRRQRSQIIAYTVVGIMILVLAAGIAFAVSKITGMSHNRQEQKNKLDDIIASEETITAPTTEPVETIPELTNEQKLDKIIDEAIIQNLPLEDKVAGLFITTPESITGVSAAVQAGDGTKDALSKYPVGGIVYAAKNIQSADQLKQMIDNTKLYTSYPLFIAMTEKDPELTLWQRQALERRPIPRRPSAHPEMPTTPILSEPQWAVTWQSLVSILILPLRQI